MDKSLSKLLDQDVKEKPQPEAAIDARKLAKIGSAEGVNLLKKWAGRDKSLFLDIALSALMSAPKEMVIEDGFLDVVRDIFRREDYMTQHVRAASLLGEFSEWPDPALSYAMQHDESPVVRGEAFRSALMLAGVPYAIAREHAARVENNNVQATPELVDKLAKEYK